MYAERIRALRLSVGLSQQELGRRLGVSAVAVGKWERGQTQPDIPSLTRMADIFGTTIDDLCELKMVWETIASIKTVQAMDAGGRFLANRR